MGVIESTTARTPTALAPLILVSSGLVLAALPLFLVGGLAVQMRADLGFDKAGLGLAVTVGFVVGAIAAPFGGRLADRVGPRFALYLGALLSGLTLLGIGLFADSWGRLVALLAVAGLSMAITDPGLATLVNNVIRPDRHGLAFGLKEASIPAATLAAGAAVPAIALTVGWRWAFAIGALPLAVIIALLPRIVPPGHMERRGERDHQPAPAGIGRSRRAAVLLTAVAAALGTAAASGVGVFLTESAVAMGISPGAAGGLLAVGSVAGIATRITSGIAADYTGHEQFKLIAIMMGVGAITIALGGTGNNVLLVIGTIGAFTGGWGWTGILFLSLVRVFPNAPGTVSGIGTAGLGVGNAIGPLLFGVVAQTYTFRAAWLGAGVVAGIGALVMLWASRAMSQQQNGAAGP